MEEVQVHFQTFYRYYIVAVLLVVPPLVIWRRYIGPVLAYCLKGAMCSAGFHGLVHMLVLLAAWFKGESTLRYSNAEGDYGPGWTTPLFAFWDRHSYTPVAIFYLELAALAAIFFIIWRNQPVVFPRNLKVQASKKAAAQAEITRKMEITRKAELTRKLEQSRRSQMLRKDSGDRK